MQLLEPQILRSILKFPDDEQSQIINNLLALRSEIEPVGVDKNILEFVGNIYDKSLEVPSYDLVISHFSNENLPASAAALSRLQALNTVSVDSLLDNSSSSEPQIPALLTGADFRYALEKYKTDVAKEATSSMLLEASQILTTGVRGKSGIIQGSEAAIEHLAIRIGELNNVLKKNSIEGSFRHDAAKVRKQYERWRDNKETTVGTMTGISAIDSRHRGALPGELCLVAGFVSHLKTTFCINWAYNAAVMFGRNSGFVALETHVDILRTLIYVMHSSHAKFREEGTALDYEKVTTGSLSEDEERFYRMVIDDFETCPDYGEILYKESSEDSITVADIKRWAEGKHKNVPLDLLVIDYLGLVDPEKGRSSMDSNANLNRVIRQAKNLAQSFDQGKGIAVVSPHQTNRQGLLDAEKNNGRYKITALANTNEAERSADLIYYCYLDETLQNSRELVMGNMKARNKPLIRDIWKVFADPSTRVIANLDASTGVADLVTI